MLTVRKTSQNAHSWEITPNTGRNQTRFYSQAYVDSSKSANAVVTYIQEGKPEFIELSSPSSVSLPATPEGMAYFQINAKSNSSRVYVKLEPLLTNFIDLNIQNVYINGSSYKEGAIIAGDPGANEEYIISINVGYPENTISSQINNRIVLEDNAGHSVVVVVTQAAAEPVITVNPTSVEVPSAGGSGTIMVSSNEEWFVSTIENI